MNIRKRIANWIFKPELEKFHRVAEEVASDWRMIPYTMRAQQGLVEMLQEMDPRLYDMMVRQIRDYQVVNQPGSSETFRMSVVQQSRSMFLTDPVISSGIAMWTDFAFGEAPNLTADDPAAQEVWDLFWQAGRNAPILGERKLHRLSEVQLTDGEIFFIVFASTVDGECTIRTIPTDQIREVVKDPDDASVVLYYRRDFVQEGQQKTIYYPDWSTTLEQRARAPLPADAQRAEASQAIGDGPGTDVVVLHAAFRELNGRGWPLATSGLDWATQYATFLKDRAAVAKAAATWVEKIKAKGGQRALDMMKQKLGSSIGGGDSFETNPPPVAGSTWLENEALDRQWMNRPTGAQDAEKDGIPLVTQVGLSMRMFPHYLGRGDYYRLATATAMEMPTLKAFNRYQAFWSSVWRDLFKIVAGFSQKYGGKSLSSLEAQVSTDRVVNLSIEEIQRAQGSVLDLVDRNLINIEVAERILDRMTRASLETMGIQGVDEMFEQETQAEEAGVDQPPFSESKSGVDQYQKNLRAAVYGLWSGKITREDFVDSMQVAIDAGLRNAWMEGMAAVGLGEEDLTQEEIIAISDAVLQEYSHIDGFADAIEAGSKANGGKLADLQYRLSLWVNRYNQLRARAMLMAKTNPPLKWNYGPTDHCDDCQYANGRVYRASVWARWGWETQSQNLACHGFKCRCSLESVPPGTKLTPGHPRRPTGG